MARSKKDQTEQDQVGIDTETSASAEAEDVSKKVEADAEETAEDETPDESTPETEPAIETEEPMPGDKLAAEAEDTDNSGETPLPPVPVTEKIVEVRKGGIGGVLVGGALAAVLGAAAAYYVMPKVPGLLPAPQDDTQNAAIASLDEKTAELESSISGNSAEIETLSSAIAAQDPAAELQRLRAELAAAQDRIAELEARPLPSSAPSPETMAAVDTELSKMRTQLQDELAKIQEASTAVAESQQAASLRAEQAAALAALGRVQAAVDAGQPYAEDLGEISSDGLSVPAALAANANSGVATLASLQESYPDAARKALAAAVDAEAADDTQGKISAFFRKQLGVRSLEPREGDSADAVLSRAEAALRGGDVAGALTELDALSGAPAEKISDWRATAQARIDTSNALAELSQQLSQ